MDYCIILVWWSNYTSMPAKVNRSITYTSSTMIVRVELLDGWMNEWMNEWMVTISPGLLRATASTSDGYIARWYLSIILIEMVVTFVYRYDTMRGEVSEVTPGESGHEWIQTRIMTNHKLRGTSSSFSFSSNISCRSCCYVPIIVLFISTIIIIHYSYHVIVHYHIIKQYLSFMMVCVSDRVLLKSISLYPITTFIRYCKTNRKPSSH
jgi:hypothetical protein